MYWGLTEPKEAVELNEEAATAEVTVHSKPVLTDNRQKQVAEEQEPVTTLCRVKKGDQPLSQYKDGAGIKEDEIDEAVTSSKASPEADTADSSEYFADAETSMIEPVTTGKIRTQRIFNIRLFVRDE